MDYWINGLLLEADQLLPIAQAADELGFAGIALPDHAVMPDVIASQYPGGAMPWTVETDWPDVWVTIGVLAASTTRLRFATNVYVLPARHPLVTAKAVGTAAFFSGGRVVLGAGVGWMEEEFAALDEDFSTRGARADEAIAILRQAFSAAVIERRGTHYDVPRLRLRPAPPAPVPIWIGGESPAALRRAARLGDGWISGRTPQDIEPLIPRLAAERKAAGRDAEPFDLVASLQTEPDAGQFERVAKLGIGNLKVQPWGWYGGDSARLDTKLAGLQRFAEQHLRDCQ